MAELEMWYCPGGRPRKSPRGPLPGKPAAFQATVNPAMWMFVTLNTGPTARRLPTITSANLKTFPRRRFCPPWHNYHQTLTQQTCVSKWQGEHLDYGMAMDALWVRDRGPDGAPRGAYHVCAYSPSSVVILGRALQYSHFQYGGVNRLSTFDLCFHIA